LTGTIPLSHFTRDRKVIPNIIISHAYSANVILTSLETTPSPCVITYHDEFIHARDTRI